MALSTFLKRFSIIIIAILALLLTRIGISYLVILIGIGIIVPIICENKSYAIYSGILYATISYIISYPSGLFLINYMPTTSIPISVSSFEVFINLLTALLIPVIITIILIGVASFIGEWIAGKVHKENNDNLKENTNYDSKGYYFEEYDDSTSSNHTQYTSNIRENFFNKNNHKKDSLKKNHKKDLLSLTSIQKAKNRKENDED